jgi:hypothetical protein
MKARNQSQIPVCSSLALGLALLAGCGSDSESVTNPGQETPPTHFEISVQMSSIWAQNDCENTPGNPGDFRWRLILRKPDEFGNKVIVHDTGTQTLTVPDGIRSGVAMDPVRFLVPNSQNSSFEVEHWVGEYDPGTDFERHSWATHVLDRGRGQMWAAGDRSYEDDRYTENEDGSGSGLYKFAVWNTRAECSGAAYYYVTWTPVTPEPTSEPNNPPTVGGPVTVTLSEFDPDASVSLLTGASDPDGDPLDAIDIALVSGSNRGITIDDANDRLLISPSQYSDLSTGESEAVIFEYDIFDGVDASVRQSAQIRINGG